MRNDKYVTYDLAGLLYTDHLLQVGLRPCLSDIVPESWASMLLLLMWSRGNVERSNETQI